MKIKETELRKIINESVDKALKEGNYMRNADAANLYNNCDKAEAHIKAAMNIWQKVGKQDEIRGRADSQWAIIMKTLKQVKDAINAYSFESLEAEAPMEQ